MRQILKCKNGATVEFVESGGGPLISSDPEGHNIVCDVEPVCDACGQTNDTIRRRINLRQKPTLCAACFEEQKK